MSAYEPAKIPINEEARKAYVHKTGVMDSKNLDRYDTYVLSAKAITGCPVAYTGLLDEDRQYFLAQDFNGHLDVAEVARPQTLCQYALLSPEPLIVEDLREHPKLRNNPLVTDHPHWVFWGAFPLVTSDGLVLGTLCTVDYQPRSLTQNQIVAMRALADNMCLFLTLQMQERIDGTERMAAASRAVLSVSPNMSLQGFAAFLDMCEDKTVSRGKGSELITHGIAEGDKTLTLTALGRELQNENGLVASSYRRKSKPTVQAMSIDSLFEMME
jgi:hypothetical protein